MDDLLIAVLFDECGHMLDRPPSSDVPVFILAEDAIQQACRAEQSYMASM
jgi:hypothetical protein